MGNAIIYAGIVIGVAALTGIMVYGTADQQARIPETSVDAPATLEGPIPSTTGLGPVINKEQWHDDSLADEAAEVKAKLGL